MIPLEIKSQSDHLICSNDYSVRQFKSCNHVQPCVKRDITGQFNLSQNKRNDVVCRFKVNIADQLLFTHFRDDGGQMANIHIKSSA